MTGLPTSPWGSCCRRGRGNEEAMRSWSDLPDDSLHVILTRLCSLVDFISFSSVCRSWRAVASSVSSPSPTTFHFPPLLLRPTFSPFGDVSSIRVLDPASSSFSTSLSPNPNIFKLSGSFSFSHGCLVVLMVNRVRILNPFTGAELCSPPAPPDYIFSRSPPLLTSPITSPDSAILVFSNGSLLYWRIGSPSWSRLLRVLPRGDITMVTVQGKVYVMDALPSLYELELYPQLHLRPIITLHISQMRCTLQHYLVECGGELLHLELELTTTDVVSARIEVSQLNLCVNGAKWVKKEALPNWAIFVARDHHLPCYAVENPERWGGTSNCVYFATGHANSDSPWAVAKLGEVIPISYINPELPLCRMNFRHMVSSTWYFPGF